ncbi:MAG: hypothetical protein ACPGXY_01795 [Alphaproteobacteria bacterium]
MAASFDDMFPKEVGVYSGNGLKSPVGNGIHKSKDLSKTHSAASSSARDRADPNKSSLEYENGLRFLARSINEQGIFPKTFMPLESGGSLGYDMDDHATTIWCMTRINKYARDSFVSKAIERGRNFILSDRMKRYAYARTISYRRVADTGAVASTILSLTSSGDYSNQILRDLGEYLLFCIDDDGSLYCHKRSLVDNAVLDNGRLDYPGRVILALAHLARALKDENFYNVARQMIENLASSRDAIQAYHDFYLMEALMMFGNMYKKYVSKISSCIFCSPDFIDSDNIDKIARRTNALITSYRVTRDTATKRYIRYLVDIMRDYQATTGDVAGGFATREGKRISVVSTALTGLAFSRYMRV